MDTLFYIIHRLKLHLEVVLAILEIVPQRKAIVSADGSHKRQPQARRTLLARALIEAFEDMVGIERCRARVGDTECAAPQDYLHIATLLTMYKAILQQVIQ